MRCCCTRRLERRLPSRRHASVSRAILLLVESGEPGRVSRVDIAGDTGKVTTLQQGFPGGPVSATIVGSDVYVVEAQFAGLSANTLKPFQVLRFPLP